MESIECLYDKALNYLDVDLSERYCEGCKRNILNYVKRVSSDDISEKDGRILISDSLLSDDYVKRYFNKGTFDLNAKQVALLALNHPHIPPLDDMAIGSLEKKILSIIREKTDVAYIKRT